jgi:hypothetical protein
MVTASEVQSMINMERLVALPFHPSHMDRLQANNFDLAVFASLPDLPQRLALLQEQRCAWTLFYKHEPAVCMGLEYKWPTNYEAWLVPGKVSVEHGALLTRGAKRFFDNIGPKLDLLRMQIVVNVEREAAVRWAEFLKFEREGVMTKYGPEGADYYMYARTY